MFESSPCDWDHPFVSPTLSALQVLEGSTFFEQERAAWRPRAPKPSVMALPSCAPHTFCPLVAPSALQVLEGSTFFDYEGDVAVSGSKAVMALPTLVPPTRPPP